MSDEDRIHTQIANMAPQFARALPSHIPVERFARVLTTAVNLNPDLLKVDRVSLMAAATRAAEDGLLPDGRQGVIIARGNKAVWQTMVSGVRTKARNSGELISWDVQAVFENDLFEFELGDDPYVKHRFDLKTPRGPLLAVYSVAKLKGGAKSYDVMTIAEVREVRDRYSQSWKSRKSGSPWLDAEAEMAKKTIAHRHAKMLPMSTDLQRTVDSLMAGDMDPRGAEAPRRQQLPPTTRGKLDMLARGSHAAPTLPDEPEDIPVDEGGEDITPKDGSKPPRNQDEEAQERAKDRDKIGDDAREAPSPPAAGSSNPPTSPAAPAAEPPVLGSDIGRDLMQKLAHNLALARTQKDIDRICTKLFDLHPINPESPFYRLAADIRLAHMRRIAGESSPAEADEVVGKLLAQSAGSISSQ